MTPPRTAPAEPATTTAPAAADAETTTAPEAASSEASSTSSPFVGATGPGFDPEATATDLRPEAPDLAPAGTPEVSEETVRGALLNGGDGLHAAIGVGDADWAMTEADLNRIAPSLTRIINRYDRVRAVASHSDEAAVAVGVGLYAWRSMLERGAVLDARRADENTAAPKTAAPPAASDPAAAGGPAPIIETPDGYVPAAERIRQARQENNA